jgi:hypothetical protein
MGNSELSAARARIEVAEKRLAALQDIGIETAPLRSQILVAREKLKENDPHDVVAICDEVLTTIKRLAKGSSKRAKTDVPLSSLADAWNSDRATHTAHEQVRDEVRAILVSEGLVSNMVAQQIAIAEKDGQARLSETVRQLREQFARELAQVMATKPWESDMHRLKVSGNAAQTAFMDGITVVKQQIELAQKNGEARLQEVVKQIGGGTPPKAAEAGSSAAEAEAKSKAFEELKAQVKDLQHEIAVQAAGEAHLQEVMRTLRERMEMEAPKTQESQAAMKDIVDLKLQLKDLQKDLAMQGAGEAHLQEAMRQMRDQFTAAPKATESDRIAEEAFKDLQGLRAQMKDLQHEIATQAAGEMHLQEVMRQLREQMTAGFEKAAQQTVAPSKSDGLDLEEPDAGLTAGIQELQKQFDDLRKSAEAARISLKPPLKNDDDRLPDLVRNLRQEFKSELMKVIEAKPWENVFRSLYEPDKSAVQALKTQMDELQKVKPAAPAAAAHSTGSGQALDVQGALDHVRAEFKDELAKVMAAKPWEKVLQTMQPQATAPAPVVDRAAQEAMEKSILVLKSRIDDMQNDSGFVGDIITKQLTGLQQDTENKLDGTVKEMREQFARELQQVLASKPWESAVERVATAATGKVSSQGALSDEFQIMKSQIQDLKKEITNRDGWYSPEDIRRLLAEIGALNPPATGESGTSRAQLPATEDEPVTVVVGDQPTKLHGEMADRMRALEGQIKEMAAKIEKAGAAGADSKGGREPGTASSDWMVMLEDSHPNPPPQGPTEVAEQKDKTKAKPAPEPMSNDTTSNIPHAKPVPIPAEISVEPLTPIAGYGTAGNNAPGEASVTGPGISEAEFRRRMTQYIPEVLRQPAIQNSLFAILALEATSKPNALGELTGLRSFLRREINLIADQVRKELAAEVA